MSSGLFSRSACLAALMLATGPALADVPPVTAGPIQPGPDLAAAAGEFVLAQEIYVRPVLPVPPGWRERPTPDGRLVLVGPDGLSLIIAFREIISMNAAVERLSQPIEIAAGSSLNPRSVPRKDGDVVRNDFLATGFGPLTKAQVTVRTENAGRALVLIGLIQPGMEPQLAQAFARLLPPAEITPPSED